MTQAQFRIGGVYRQQNGSVRKLEAHTDPKWAYALSHIEGNLFSDALGGDGARRLDDGRYVHYVGDRNDDITLLPGELHQVDGQWVPVEEKAIKTEFSWVTAARQRVQANRAADPTAEPKRPPLTWATKTEFDRWDGFAVDRMDINMPCDPWKNNCHPLQRMTTGDWAEVTVAAQVAKE